MKKITDDPDECRRCYHNKAEGYFSKGQFVREENARKLRELCNEWPEAAPVCAECGEELRIQAEEPEWGFKFIDKIMEYADGRHSIRARICFYLIVFTHPFWFTLATVGKITKGTKRLYNLARERTQRRNYQQR
jgi:hypothetical protein